MGCDIHMYVEVQNEEGIWKFVSDAVFSNPYKSLVPSEPEKINQPYTGRNYSLFAILADVRNYEDVEPISLPRGVPDDVSTEYKELADWVDTHSHTWYVLSELLEWNWYSFPTFETALKECLTLHSDPNKIRLVMFFDN